MTRFVYFLLLAVLTALEIGPIPITGQVLIWVVLFRPLWFYDLVQSIYQDALSADDDAGATLIQELQPQMEPWRQALSSGVSGDPWRPPHKWMR